MQCNSVNREKLVRKLEKHSLRENLNSLNIKKYNAEIWSELLQSGIWKGVGYPSETFPLNLRHKPFVVFFQFGFL